MDLAYEGINQITIANQGSGSVDVVPSSDNTVTGRISCADPDYLDKIMVRQIRSALQIDFPKAGWFRDQSVFVELAAPDDLSMQIATGSADVRVAAPIRQSKITSGSGDLDIEHADGLQCTTGSGDISVQTITGDTSSVSTGSGDISIQETSAALQVKSASGDVVVNRLSDALRANTASGDIQVSATTGSIDARTASGSVRIGVAESLPAWLDLNSRSGDVDIDLDNTETPGPGDPYVAIKAVTASGDIAITRA